MLWSYVAPINNSPLPLQFFYHIDYFQGTPLTPLYPCAGGTPPLLRYTRAQGVNVK